MGDPLWHTLDLAKDASVEEIIGVVARDPQVVAILFTIRPDAAHSRYNALIRRLVSYERAAECAN